MGSGTISAVSGNVSVIAGGGFSSTGLISTQNGSISIASANPVIASNTTVTNGVLSAQPSVGALATGGISTAGLIANANISLQGKGSIEVFNGIETSNPGTIDIGSGDRL